MSITKVKNYPTIIVFIGVLVAAVTAVSLWSVFGSSVAPGDKPPVVVEQPKPTPQAPTVKPTPKPTSLAPETAPTLEVVEPTPKPVQPQVAVEPTPVPKSAMNSILIPENFIVADEHWANAFIPHAADGTRLGGGVGFSDIPVGAEIFAPFTGYIHTFGLEGENETLMGIMLSGNKYWIPPLEDLDIGRYVIFMAIGFETIGDGSFVKKEVLSPK